MMLSHRNDRDTLVLSLADLQQGQFPYPPATVAGDEWAERFENAIRSRYEGFGRLVSLRIGDGRAELDFAADDTDRAAADLALTEAAEHAARAEAKQTEAALRRATERAPRFPLAHLALGRFYLDVGEAVRAEAAFLKTLDLTPRSAEAWVGLARARYRMDDEDGALEAIDRAVHHRPDAAECWSTRAALRLALDQTDGAVADYEQAVALAPTDPTPRLGLAHALRDAGHTARALAALTELRTIIPPTHPFYAVAQARQTELAALLADDDRADS